VEARDVFPAPYRANTVTALRDIAGRAGFVVAELCQVATLHRYAGGRRALTALLLALERLLPAHRRSTLVALLRPVLQSGVAPEIASRPRDETRGGIVFRAEVIGSMLRPSYLKEARAAFEAGRLAPHDFKRLEDRAVDQVIAIQEGTGVDVVSDGEMRRYLFMGPITETVDGIEPVDEGTPMPWASPGGELELAPPKSMRPSSRPWSTHASGDGRSRSGCPPSACLTEGLDLIIGMVDGITGVRLGLHLCRGNNAGMWMASGGYDYIASALFERAKAFDAFFLEYDDARSGSFEPLSQAPDDKQLVLGLVSTKTLEMETPEQLMARIEEAARFYPREQLGLSTQCGFASVAVGNPITEKVEEEKLRLVADVAHTAWS
jgi:methionine synthase II (cobalamin-independent)